MRKLNYISPTSLSKFYADRQEFYLQYMADAPPPKIPQSKAMSVGSAFDALVKDRISKRYYGISTFEKLFEDGVEAHNRDWALEAGKQCMVAYEIAGGLRDMYTVLDKGAGDIKMEFFVDSEVDGIPVKIRPDLWFRVSGGSFVIIDWKVNGYCSKSGASPTQGYVMCRDGFLDTKPTRGSGKCHTLCAPAFLDGIMYNMSHTLDMFSTEWATQLCIYTWGCGLGIGEQFLVGIDQLACKNGKIRVAQHRSKISQKFQNEVIFKLHEMWVRCQSPETVFDLSVEQSISTCCQLDNYSKNLNGEFGRICR